MIACISIGMQNKCGGSYKTGFHLPFWPRGRFLLPNGRSNELGGAISQLEKDRHVSQLSQATDSNPKHNIK